MTDYFYQLAHKEMDQLLLFVEKEENLMKRINYELEAAVRSSTTYLNFPLIYSDLKVLKDALERYT
jgi:hypothetical protein